MKRTLLVLLLLLITAAPLQGSEDLTKALEAAAALPLRSQRAVLQQIGEKFSASGFQCNAFGGKNSCVGISTNNTALGSTCGIPGTTVDCAFKYESQGASQRDPNQKLKQEGFGGCAECSTAAQNFWCGQTLPACGTFDGVVDELLPVVASVATKKATTLGALKESIPRILQAASLGLPCRKMCDAITDTCGCGHPHTFGEVMIALQKKASSADAFNVSISASTAKELFVRIWHTPVCQLFSAENTPGFHGSCEQASAPDMKCEWCKGKARSTVFQEQVVVQLSQMFYGIMEGGLHHALMAAAGGKGSIQENWSQSLSDGGKVSQARHTGVVLLLFLLLALAVGAFVTAVKAHRHRQVPSLYIDLNSMGYTPPML